MLKPSGISEEIEALGVPIYSSGAQGFFSLGWLPTLRAALRKHNPDLICGQTDLSNLQSYNSSSFS